MLNLTDIINRSLPVIQMLFQKIRKTYDRIHRCPDIMTHIEEKTRFCFICPPRFPRRAFQFFFMTYIFITPHLILPVTDRHQHSHRHREHRSENPLSNRYPPILRHNLKIPGIIRHCADNLQRILQVQLLTLINNNFLPCIQILFPDLEIISGLFQLVQLHFPEKITPVHNQNGKTPELLFPVLIRHIDRVKKKSSHFSLYQLIRSCNRILATLHGKPRFLLSRRILQHIQPHCSFISLHRVNL